jgi:hypothetical protein
VRAQRNREKESVCVREREENDKCGVYLRWLNVKRLGPEKRSYQAKGIAWWSGTPSTSCS